MSDIVIKESLSDKPVQLKRISENVWKITDSVYSDIETLMNAGFFEGKSAAEIAKELKQFLNNPNILSIEEIDELVRSSQITASQAQKLESVFYNTVVKRGVYKSSLANAFRLARTEINNAYHNQDYINRQRLPFVIGITVNLSANHDIIDMCDDLKGKYPPDFIFTSWHPNCKCFTTSILAPESEIRKFYRDENPNFKNVNKLPTQSTKWLKNNATRINKSKNKPFWITDNEIKL